MKKILIIIFLILLGTFGYIYYSYINNYKMILNGINSEFKINSYSIFGQFLNMNACIEEDINNIDDFELIFKNNKEEIKLNANFYKENNKICFEFKNDGLYLDNLKRGKYLLLVKENDKYYTLKNNTEYSDLEYYTVTKDNSNNKISTIFNKFSNKNYLEFKIKKVKLPNNVYDITIDAGHGGKDNGASFNYNNETYNESSFTLDVSLILKEKLEQYGYKVKLTRDSDVYLESYGENGRVVIPNLFNSKYSFSIHVNSSDGKQTYGGVEVYIPNTNKIELPKLIALNLSNIVGYSKNPTYKISDGVYYKYFTNYEIESAKKEWIEKGLEPYDIKENTPYMYMIREIGGINTNAYIDGRNDSHGINPYYNSNLTAEPYLIEMGYINYVSDLSNLINRKEKFANGIADAIYKYFTNIS